MDTPQPTTPAVAGQPSDTPPGYSPPGYGPPSYGPPVYGPPGYVPPAYGRPGYGPLPSDPAAAPPKDRSSLAVGLAVGALAISILTGVGTVLGPALIGLGLFGSGLLSENPGWAEPGVSGRGSGHVAVEPGGSVAGTALADELRPALTERYPSVGTLTCPDVPHATTDLSLVCRVEVELRDHRFVVVFDDTDGGFTFVDLQDTD